jgi:trigger factor
MGVKGARSWQFCANMDCTSNKRAKKEKETDGDEPAKAAAKKPAKKAPAKKKATRKADVSEEKGAPKKVAAKKPAKKAPAKKKVKTEEKTE